MKVSEKLLDGRELEFYKWEGDVSEMLKDVREKLNRLGEVRNSVFVFFSPFLMHELWLAFLK